MLAKSSRPVTMETETRVLNDRAEEDEEEEEDSRWTGLSVQSVSLWTGLGFLRLQWFPGCSRQCYLFLPCLGMVPLSRHASCTAPHRHHGPPSAPLRVEGGCWDW